LSRTATPRLEPGRVLAGRYRIERFLGEGAMGVVYLAEHELLRQKVALKLMRQPSGDELQARARFLGEARNASRIQSDHVVRVMDAGVLDAGAPFLVMELLEGEDLGAILRTRSPLPIADTVDWLLEAIDGIAHAHAQGIVHRDLKPSNLFLSTRPDGTGRIKVLDFGISKAVDPEWASGITGTHAVLGTPSYMSPEQLRGAKAVDARTDVWALGVTAYELLTGELPFRGDNAVALFAATTETRPTRPRVLRPEIPEALEEAILHCLAPSREDRFDTVAALGEALAPHGTPAAAGTLARVQSIPARETSAPAAASPSTLDEEQPSPSVADEQPSPSSGDPQQSVSPWSDGRSSKRVENRAEPPTDRWVAMRSRVLMGSLALSVAAGVTYAVARGRALPAPVAASGQAASLPVALDSARVDAQPVGPSSQGPPARVVGEGVPSSAADAHSATSLMAAGPPLRRTSASVAPDTSAAKLSPAPSSPVATPGAAPSDRAPSSAAPSGTPLEPARQAPPSCNPPYTIDAQGHRQYKPECP
jgi:serine/threonine-protein kinase